MPRKSVAVVGIGVGLEDIFKKNQRELFISMLFQCYLTFTNSSRFTLIQRIIYHILIYRNMFWNVSQYTNLLSHLFNNVRSKIYYTNVLFINAFPLLRILW